MILRNPTDNRIEVQIDGKQYHIEAQGKITLPDDVAVYWKTYIHQFLKVDGEKVIAKEEAEVEDVKEEKKEKKVTKKE